MSIYPSGQRILPAYFAIMAFAGSVPYLSTVHGKATRTTFRQGFLIILIPIVSFSLCSIKEGLPLLIMLAYRIVTIPQHF